MRRMAGVLVGVVLVVALGACGSSDDNSSESTMADTSPTSADAESITTTASVPVPANPDDIEDALREFLQMRAAGQNGPAWDLLVPQQQEIIPRTTFLACGDATGGLELDSVSVEETYDEQVEIPGSNTLADSTAATIRITYTLAGRSRTETTTVHLLDVDGQWRFMLDPDTVEQCMG